MAGTLSLPTLVQKVLLDTKGAEQGASRAEKSMRGAANEAGRLGSTVSTTGRQFRIGSLAILAGAAAVVVGLKKAVDAAADYATGVRKLATFSGASAEEASKLAFVLGRFGIPVESAIRPLSTLSKLIETGGGKLSDFFSTADLARFRTQPLIDTLLDINTRYHELNTTTQKNALLQIALGRGAISLRRFFTADRKEIEQLAEEAKKFGLVLTQDNLDAFKQFSDESRELGQAFKGLQVQIGLALIPAFKALDAGLTGVITKFNELPAGLRNVITTGLLLVATIGLIGKGFDLLVGSIAVKFVVGLAGAIATVARLAIGLDALVELFGVIDAVGAVGGGIFAGLVAATVGLAAATGAAAGGIIAYSINLVDGQHAAEDYAETAGHMTDTLLRVVGGTREGALAAGEFNKTVNQMADDGTLTEEALDGIVSGFDLVIKAARNGKSIGPIVKALAAGNREAAAQLAGVGDAASSASDDLQQYKDDVDGIVAALTIATIAQKEVTDSTTGYADAIRQFGVESDEAKDAQEELIAKILAQQDATAGAAEDDKEKAKRRVAAEEQVLKVTQETTDAIQKEAQAVKDARDKEVEANAKLIASFDLLNDQTFDPQKDRADALDKVREAEQKLTDARDKVTENQRHLTRTPELNKDLEDAKRDVDAAKHDLEDARKDAAKASKSALSTFEDSTSANTDFTLNFISNLRKIAANGGEALAAELQAQGPKGAKAAAEAVKLIGTDGFANLEKVAVDAMIAAKLAADAKWDEWPGNFAEKGALAGEAAKDAIIKKLKEFEKEHPELKLEIEAEITKINIAAGLSAGVAVAQGLSAIPIGIGHLGGLVTTRGIKRYHRGGLAGDERLSILRVGESVLTPEATRAIGPENILAANRGDVAAVTNNSRTENWNIGAVMAQDMDDMVRQLDRRRRLASLVNL